MTYFNSSFIKFFRELSQNNSFEWFDQNRKTYENEVKKPFSDFVAEMILRINQHEPDVQIRPSDAMVRINRDIRFSKDKTPYKNHVAANISRFGKRDMAYPGFFFQLSHEAVTIYGGIYMVENPVLHNIRSYIAENLKSFSDVYNDKSFSDKFGSILGEKNKRLPTEFRDIEQKEPLIANKQFYYTASLEPSIITTPELPDRLMEYYMACKKVNEFFKKAVGR